MEKYHADIHYFFPHPQTGEVSTEDEGDPILGFYYQIKDEKGPVGHMTGPYGTAEEAEAECQKAWSRGDF